MDLLHKVTPCLRIKLLSARQPLHGAAKELAGLFVEFILRKSRGQHFDHARLSLVLGTHGILAHI